MTDDSRSRALIRAGRKERLDRPSKAIADRILELRQQTGLSQEEFASGFAMSSRTYQSYERGDTDPSLQFIRALIRAGISADWLLTGKGPQRADQAPTGAAKPTLDSVVRAAFDEFINGKGGWDGDFEPVIAAVVAAVRVYFEHDFVGDVSKAVERELHRILGEK